MIEKSEGSIYILTRRPGGGVYYGRIGMQDLLDPEDKENDVRVNYHGRVLDFNKDAIFRDEVIPEIEPDSYNELISDHIDNYTGRHIIRVMEIARAN